MCDKTSTTSKLHAAEVNDNATVSDVNALIALLDYIQPEVVAISATAAILLRLAQRALAEDHQLH